MAKAVLVFRDAAIEKARLEEEAAKQRLYADDERGRNEQGQREAIAQRARDRRRFDRRGLVETGRQGSDLSHVARNSRSLSQASGRFQRCDLASSKTRCSASTGSADAIHSGSQEISAATSDLSRRTEQQAASLEETAATLDEVTATAQEGGRRRDPRAQGRRHRAGRCAKERRSHPQRRRRDGRDREILAADQPDHRRHRRDRVPDQSARAERRRRGGAGGRRGPRLCRRRRRSARAGAAFGGGGQGDQGTDFDFDDAGRATASCWSPRPASRSSGSWRR